MDHGLDYYDYGFSGFGTGFAIFEIMFTVVFVLIIGVFIFILAKGIGQWNKNNHSPKLSIPATIVAKRTRVSSHHHHTGTHSTSYYVTFQVESGDRMELHVAGYEFGMLIEGDRGILTFQGTRYLGFERKLEEANETVI